MAFALVAAAVLALALLSARWRRRALAAAGMLALAVALAFVSVRPSNDRDWAPEYARLARASIEGERVTLRDVRAFEYRSEADFTPRYYDRSFDLRELDSLDLVSSYWMGEAIAHTFLSFGFAGRDYLAISIETRRERGEGYSAIAGFFRRYELAYVVADERDVVRLRTNYRRNPPEDVYLFRVRAEPAAIRAVFLDYLREVNALAEQPAFYNTLTTNCTTNILTHLRVNPGAPALSWKVLLSGYAAQYAWEHGALAPLPFAELRARSRVNAAALAADAAPDFSQRIRAGLPALR